MPAAGDAPRVTEAEIAELHPIIADWELIDVEGVNRLRRSFRFRNFQQAMDFSMNIGQMAEEEGHHPKLVTEWGAGDHRLVDPQNSRPPPQRLHHGREDGPGFRDVRA